MMLLRTPASNWPTITTAGSRRGWSLRETMVCIAVTISPASAGLRKAGRIRP